MGIINNFFPKTCVGFIALLEFGAYAMERDVPKAVLLGSASLPSSATSSIGELPSEAGQFKEFFQYFHEGQLAVEKRGQYEVRIKELVGSGYSVRSKNGSGVPLLVQLTLLEYSWAVRIALQHGADPNNADAHGLSPLMHTIGNLDLAKHRDGSLAIMDLLLRHGANPKMRSPLLQQNTLELAESTLKDKTLRKQVLVKLRASVDPNS